MRKSIICTTPSKLSLSGQQNKLGTVYVALNSYLAAKSAVVAAQLLVRCWASISAVQASKRHLEAP
ncbi:MAG: hypothetical protein ACI9SK_001617 [Zhongshania sp.]|jgi:hypothetical protein